MKKSLKIKIAIVLLLTVSGAGILYYFLNVKKYEIADAKVEEITENDYQIDLPDLHGDSTGKDGKDEENAGKGNKVLAEGGGTADPDKTDSTSFSKVDSDPVVAANSGGSSDIVNEKKAYRNPSSGDALKRSTDGKKNSDPSTDGNSNTPAITAETIKAAYRPSFESLQAQANAKIDALVNTAYSEYQTKKQNDESVSITYFYRKYSSAGNELERNTDETFHYIYDSLVNDLEDRGFSESEANEFKTQYESAKKARESALIEKAKNAL